MSVGRWTCADRVPSWKDIPLGHPDVEFVADDFWRIYGAWTSAQTGGLPPHVPPDAFLNLSEDEVVRKFDQLETERRLLAASEESEAIRSAGEYRAWRDAHVQWEREERP